MNDIHSIQLALNDEYFDAAFNAWIAGLVWWGHDDDAAYLDAIAMYCCI